MTKDFLVLFVFVCLESVWEPPAEGFLSVAEQEGEQNKESSKKKKEKEKVTAKKKAPGSGSKAKKKKSDKEDKDDDDEDEDGGDGGDGGKSTVKVPVAVPPVVRGEFEPFMMETTRIGSWKAVETM
jgi:hypothetical protein